MVIKKLIVRRNLTNEKAKEPVMIQTSLHVKPIVGTSKGNVVVSPKLVVVDKSNDVWITLKKTVKVAKNAQNPGKGIDYHSNGLSINMECQRLEQSQQTTIN